MKRVAKALAVIGGAFTLAVLICLIWPIRLYRQQKVSQKRFGEIDEWHLDFDASFEHSHFHLISWQL